MRALGAPGSRSRGVDVCSPGRGRARAGPRLPCPRDHRHRHQLHRARPALYPCSRVHVNADLVTQLDRIGRLAPRALPRRPARQPARRRRQLPLRCDAVQRPSGPPFGIYADDLRAPSRWHARTVWPSITVHFHVANGLLDEDLTAFDYAAPPWPAWSSISSTSAAPSPRSTRAADWASLYHPGQKPLDLDAYVGVQPQESSGPLRRHACVRARRVGQCPVGHICSPRWRPSKDRLGAPFRRSQRGLERGQPSGLSTSSPYRSSTPLAADAPAYTEGHHLLRQHQSKDRTCSPRTTHSQRSREGAIVAPLTVWAATRSPATILCLRPPAEPVFYTDRVQPQVPPREIRTRQTGLGPRPGGVCGRTLWPWGRAEHRLASGCSRRPVQHAVMSDLCQSSMGVVGSRKFGCGPASRAQQYPGGKWASAVCWHRMAPGDGSRPRPRFGPCRPVDRRCAGASCLWLGSSAGGGMHRRASGVTADRLTLGSASVPGSGRTWRHALLLVRPAARASVGPGSLSSDSAI